MIVESVLANNSKSISGNTNWKRVKNMTNEEIVAAAQSDLDAPMLIAKQLKKFHRVKLPKTSGIETIQEGSK